MWSINIKQKRNSSIVQRGIQFNGFLWILQNYSQHHLSINKKLCCSSDKNNCKLHSQNYLNLIEATVRQMTGAVWKRKYCMWYWKQKANGFLVLLHEEAEPVCTHICRLLFPCFVWMPLPVWEQCFYNFREDVIYMFNYHTTLQETSHVKTTT